MPLSDQAKRIGANCRLTKNLNLEYDSYFNYLSQGNYNRDASSVKLQEIFIAEIDIWLVIWWRSKSDSDLWDACIT